MAAPPPDFAAARDHVLTEVVRFARVLRNEGADVPVNAALPAVRALAITGLDDRAQVRSATFATLVRDPRDREAFDEAFETFWYRLRTGLDRAADAGAAAADGEDAGDDEGATPPEPGPVPVDEAPSEGGDDDDGGGLDGDDARLRTRRVTESAEAGEADDGGDDGRAGTYSGAGRREAVETRTEAEDRVDRAALGRFESALATLSGRRWSRAPGESIDARRALRESLDTGGVAMDLPRRERKEDAFRTCLIVDVSRSVLDAIDRGYLLSFVDALVADGRSVRAFFFDTDVREVTDTFGDDRKDPAAALADAEVAWGGGTRIGASLATVRRRWPDALDRRTAVVIVSDGLDVGDVDELEAQMARLAGRASAVVWLNPLAASPAYEPTCRGMAASLPYVDGLFAFAGDDDLREVARQLARHGAGGPVGYRHDFRDRTGNASS